LFIIAFRYFILENVRNLVNFNNSTVFQLCLLALTKMGYQTTFAILQAGCYGVPQHRKRTIIMAAGKQGFMNSIPESSTFPAPDVELPVFPQPTHSFSKSSGTVRVGDKYFVCQLSTHGSAPYKTVTVRDAMGDLPPVESGASRVTRRHPGQPNTSFQKRMRMATKDGDDILSEVYDHIVRETNPLMQVRYAKLLCATNCNSV